ncbi:MAG TPA: glycosyltransferase, partial [Acidimicrobiales bacterium]|nr:glycosyltransferase [Acidimicrobiales bacterium]
TVCTSITRARLPHARAMADLVGAHHPGTTLNVLLVDDPGGTIGGAVARAADPAPGGAGRDAASGVAPAPEPFRLLRPADLGIPAEEVHLLACCTTLDELAAVLAPRLAAHLLAEGARSVVVLDPEVVVVAPLDELSLRAEAHGVVVVPRLLDRLPDDGRHPDEVTLGHWGALDPGILAMSAARQDFAAWWAARLAHAASDERLVPLDAAQQLLDLLVGDPGVHVLRDPAYGLAWWNAHERPVEVTGEGMFLAAGRPLRLAHLQGFDPWLPYLLTADTHPAQRVLLSQHPALAELCRHHTYRLGLAGYPARLEGPGPFERCADVASTPFDERMRRLVRRGLAAAERRPATGRPPDPFDPATAEAFFDWLMTGDPASPRSSLVPRYLVEVYEDRPDLQWAFKRLSTVDALGYRHWAGYHGITEEVPPALRSHLEECAWWAAPSGVFVQPPSALQDGVTLTGYLRAELGVGEAARLVLDAVQGTRFDVSTIPVDVATSRQAHPFHQVGVPVADRRINVIWLNAEYLLGFAALVSPAFFEGRYNIGGWVWETEHLPEQMAANAAMLDEIWVPSRYVYDAVAPAVGVAVHNFPYPVVRPPADPSFRPAELGIPDGRFYFLFSFDFNSSFERKNPLGVLEAFTRAFRPGEGPLLVLKSVNGDRRPVEHERLLAAIGDRPDVVAADAYLSAAQRGALIAGAGCYVSLHRSEGFGLGMAEAMSLGRPVIATAYSGNLEFMDESNSFLVPAGRVAVGEHAPPYDPAEVWADPDLDAAAEAMRAVAADPHAAAARAEKARIRILAEHGRARAVRFLADRLAAIERLDDGGYVSSAAAGLRKLLG